MALTSLGLNERRTVGGREAMLRGAARRMERKGYSGGDFRQAAEMIRLERGSNIGSYEADVQENRTRAEMSKSLMAEGRKARGLSQEEPPDDGFTPEQRAAARGGFGGFEQQREMARRNAANEMASRGAAGGDTMPEGTDVLAERQKLFQEMQGEDITGRSGEFRTRAEKLGVTPEGFDRAVAKTRERRAKTESAASPLDILGTEIANIDDEDIPAVGRVAPKPATVSNPLLRAARNAARRFQPKPTSIS